MILPRVYPIVDDAEWIAQLGAVGVRLVQLRLKGQPQVTVAAQIRRAQGLCASFGIQLIVNDHWQLALAAGCDFVHLGQGDLEGADLGALRRAGVRLGISTHDEHELERALALAPDYVALGPIYHTTLKVMPWAPQGLARLGQWRRRVGALPLVAIGGVTLARLPEVFVAGADVAAVVSDILGAQDPPARARQWLDVAAA
ncbi:MAG TPA: thiamine phosphate synthase [Steroidobacteraceae bacterium]